jgi:hypothetical protein
LQVLARFVSQNNLFPLRAFHCNQGYSEIFHYSQSADWKKDFRISIKEEIIQPLYGAVRAVPVFLAKADIIFTLITAP